MHLGLNNSVVTFINRKSDNPWMVYIQVGHRSRACIQSNQTRNTSINVELDIHQAQKANCRLRIHIRTSSKTKCLICVHCHRREELLEYGMLVPEYHERCVIERQMDYPRLHMRRRRALRNLHIREVLSLEACGDVLFESDNVNRECEWNRECHRRVITVRRRVVCKVVGE